jgi:hypothetical protein
MKLRENAWWPLPVLLYNYHYLNHVQYGRSSATLTLSVERCKKKKKWMKWMKWMKCFCKPPHWSVICCLQLSCMAAVT